MRAVQPGRALLPDAARWRHAAQQWRQRAGMGEAVVDLGRDIGSPLWWLGCATLALLMGTALWVGGPPTPLPGRATPAFAPAAADMNRLAGLAPLARGGAGLVTNLPNRRQVVPLAEVPERPRLELSVRTSGAGLAAALRRAGVGADDLAAVQTLLAGAGASASLPAGTALDLVLGRRDTRTVPRPLEQLRFRAAFDLAVELRRTAAGLQLKRVPIAVDHTPLRIQGVVGRNLQRALRTAGLPDRLVGDAIRVLGFVVDFQHGIAARDRFDIVVEQDKAATGESRQGALLFAALRRNSGRGGNDVEVGRTASGDYFKANGESVKRGLMNTPVDGATLTSGFGMRFHPLLAFTRMHQGVDFGAPSGTPIMAAAGGTVVSAAPHGGHGNYVQLRHTDELVTAYAHMSRFAVKAGQKVRQGQIIGYVGSTGLSTGPHLHYEVWLRGKAVNPMQLRFVGGTMLKGPALAAFQRQVAGWRALPVAGAR